MAFLPKLRRLFEAEGTVETNKLGAGFLARTTFAPFKVDDAPQDEAAQELYLKFYNNVGIVAKIIDTTTEQTVQDFWFEGPSATELEVLRKELNLDRHLARVCKCMLKHGNAYVEVVKDGEKIVRLKLLPPEQMVVVRLRTGKVLAYVQRTMSKNLVWGTTDKSNSLFAGENVVVGKVSDIVHYTFNRQAGDKYGTSLMQAALKMLAIRNHLVQNLPLLMDRYLAPLIHVKVGDEQNPPSDSLVQDIKDKLRNIYMDSELVTHYAISAEVLGFKDKGALDVKELFEIVDKDIMMAMGMYPVLTGKAETGDTKSSEVQLRAESRHIKSIQRELKTEFEDKFIVAQGIGSADDQLVWGITDEREEIEHVQNTVALFNAGLLTRQKANDLLPRRYHEENLPEGDELAVGKTKEEMQMKMQNPNDPTQSTQMRDSRVKRDDVRNPLDKQVKETPAAKHEVSK